MDSLDKLLSINNSDEYSELSGEEYMFHEAVERGLLMDVLEKFEKAEEINHYLQEVYFRKSELKDDWTVDLVNEINSLISCLPKGVLLPVKKVILGDPDYNTSEMFTLRVVGNRYFRNELRKTHTPDEATFLSAFFYGVDFTHWTRFAILVKYTDLDIDLSTITRVISKGIRVAISGQDVIVNSLSKP